MRSAAQRNGRHIDADLGLNLQHWQDRLDSVQWVTGSITEFARRHRALSRFATDRQRVAVLTLLGLDGVLCAIAAAFFLPLRIGTIPFPVSALIAGLVNAALVWAALHWTSAPRVASLPLWAWLLTVAALSLGGPGDDLIFGGSGVMAYAALVLVGLGALPPAYLLYRYANTQTHSVSLSDTPTGAVGRS